MRAGRLARWQIATMLLCVIAVTLVFVPSFGTADMRIWLGWANNVETLGAVPGYAANNFDYPPLASCILLGAVRLARLVGLDTFEAIKLSIVLFLCLTSLLVWRWTKDIVLAVVLHLSLVLNSVALGYLDVYFAPALVLALWALQKRRLALFTLCFCVASLVKWQPLILVPFIACYLLDIGRVAQWRDVAWRRLWSGVLLPALAIVGVTLGVFGIAAVGSAFRASLSHGQLSGNALNFNWIVTHALHVLRPDEFGGLVNGQATSIRSAPLAVTLVPRLLFVATYVGAVVAFFRRAKTFENLLLFSLVGYLAYFTFNIGVHENHLFLASLLAVALLAVNRRHLPVALTVLLMSNVNLVLFYGVDGAGLRSGRVIGGLDVAVLLACANVAFFAFLWAGNVLRSGKSAAM